MKNVMAGKAGKAGVEPALARVKAECLTYLATSQRLPIVASNHGRFGQERGILPLDESGKLKSGADGEDRTRFRSLKRRLLDHLSFVGMVPGGRVERPIASLRVRCNSDICLPGMRKVWWARRDLNAHAISSGS